MKNEKFKQKIFFFIPFLEWKLKKSKFNKSKPGNTYTLERKIVIKNKTRIENSGRECKTI